MDEILAVRLEGFGGYDKIKVVRQQFCKTAGLNDVVVQVEACGVNFADVYTRLGLLQNETVPTTLGLEAAGYVAAIGGEVHGLAVGDRVLVHTGSHGLYAEKVLVPAKFCTKLPDDMKFTDAIALCVNYLTAYFSVIVVGRLAEGERVLIPSAAGGVGWAATQLARTVSSVQIVGVASSSKHAEIRQNGVDRCISSSDGFRTVVEETKKIFPDGVDLIVDTYGAAASKELRMLLRPLGRTVIIGANSVVSDGTVDYSALDAEATSVDAISLVMNNIGVCGFNLTTLLKDRPDVYREGLHRVFRLFQEKKIAPRIDSIYSFQDIEEAQKRLSDRQNVGKVILVPRKK